MKSWITTPPVASLLDALYADAAANDPRVRAEVLVPREAGERDFYRAMNQAYMAVSREFGHLLYVIARTAKAQTIVEFGTSFGLSTIFLASALRDNGGGQVITAEFDPGKAERARQNLAQAGLDGFVEIRVGDALETLKSMPGEIDLVFLDGAKGLYLDVLKLLEPHLRSGGIVASDNTDHDGMEAFLAYLRDSGNGYISAALLTDGGRGHEVTVKG